MSNELIRDLLREWRAELAEYPQERHGLPTNAADKVKRIDAALGRQADWLSADNPPGAGTLAVIANPDYSQIALGYFDGETWITDPDFRTVRGLRGISKIFSVRIGWYLPFRIPEGGKS